MNALTVLIVSRGLEALLQACTAALAHALRPLADRGPLRVVIVDNGSADPYHPEDFPALVRLLRFDTHHSFTACCNRAAAHAAGIVGARLLFPDGTIQHAGVVFGPGTTGPYHLHRAHPARAVPSATKEFQCVTGACMWITAPVWDALGGLDAAYPFGLEDVDFCLQARQRGVRIVCIQEPASLHFESMTEGRAALDVPSRRLFMERWQGKYTLDGEARP